MKTRTLALTLLLLATACQPLATGPDALQVIVQTETTSFSREAPLGFVDVRYSVRNQGPSTLLLARCGDRLLASLERWDDGAWVQHSADACPAVFEMDPETLAPSTTAVSFRPVSEPGRFRLRPSIGYDRGTAAEWTTAVSNEFSVE